MNNKEVTEYECIYCGFVYTGEGEDGGEFYNGTYSITMSENLE